MIKTMGGNIPGENFLSGNFPGGIFQGRGGGGGGGSLMGENFPGGSFPDTFAWKPFFHVFS